MGEEAIVLYPSPAIGHLISMVELGRLILTHRPYFSIHIVLPPLPYQVDVTAPYIASASTPSIIFHRLLQPPRSFPNHLTTRSSCLRPSASASPTSALPSNK
ncbi:unnamed protein product [Linum trigynum]|uniref:Uncharacterized protein n=1 Tax=Linum trigynum TaxID=586398 RepID=A0AAV2DCD2_9ROSI